MGDSLCLPLLCAFSLTMRCSDFLAPLPSPSQSPSLTLIAQQHARTYTNARQSWKKKKKKLLRVFLHTEAGAESPPLSLSSLRIDPPPSHLCAYILLFVHSEFHSHIRLCSIFLCASSPSLLPVFPGDNRERTASFIYISLSCVIVPISLPPPHLPAFLPPPPSHFKFLKSWLFCLDSPLSSLLDIHLCVLFLEVSAQRIMLDNEEGMCGHFCFVDIHGAKNKDRKRGRQMEGQGEKDKMGRWGSDGSDGNGS